MKIHTYSLLFCLSALAALAADETTSSVKFSDPAKPGLLRVYISHGDLEVRGGDVDAITVRSSAQPEGRSATRKDGLRVISTAASFSLTEKDNVVELNYGNDSRHGGGRAEFTIVVPRGTALDLTNGWGGDIDVEDVTGDVEVKNMNGEIDLTRLGGGALVETMNGEITASFTALPAGKALSFTSMNGEIALRIPEEAKANVRFRTQNGSILTDFDEAALLTKSEALASDAPQAASEAARVAGEVAREVAQAAREVSTEIKAAIEAERGRSSVTVRTPRAPRPPRVPSIPAMAGGKVVSGTLNGGGTDIQIATMNGDIVVRKNAPAR